MNIGACRRCLTTRSSSPLPRIGSVLAVQVTMMSNCAQPLGQLVQRDRLGAEAVGELAAALERAVGDGDRLRVASRRSASAASSIISPAPISSSRWSAIDGKMRSASFTAAAAIEIDALPMSVCVRTSFATANVRWNRRLSTRPERPGRLRRAHRLLHLAQDLRLAQHHRVEPARDAERVRDRLVLRQRVEVRRAASPCGRRWKSSSQCATGCGLAAVEIDLGPVAGRQDRRFLDLGPRQEVAQRVAQRVRRERDLLPHLERRGRVVEAEGVEGHGVRRLLPRILAYARRSARSKTLIWVRKGVRMVHTVSDGANQPRPSRTCQVAPIAIRFPQPRLPMGQWGRHLIDVRVNFARRGMFMNCINGMLRATMVRLRLRVCGGCGTASGVCAQVVSVGPSPIECLRAGCRWRHSAVLLRSIGRDYPETVSRVGDLFIEPDFELVARAERDLAYSDQRFASGDYHFDAWYAGLQRLFEYQPERGRRAVEKWKSLLGSDGSVALAEALILYGEAWEARGPGKANTVSPEGWKLYGANLEKSLAVLDQAPPKIKAIPTWNALRLGYPLAAIRQEAGSLKKSEIRALDGRCTSASTRSQPRIVPKMGGDFDAVRGHCTPGARTNPRRNRGRRCTPGSTQRKLPRTTHTRCAIRRSTGR